MKLESNRRVAACAAGFALPRYAELPTVGLYLDQSVQFVNGCFRTFQGVELTASMVSNYVKKGIISHPIKKKYTRDQLACLIYIVVSKKRPVHGKYRQPVQDAAGALYLRAGV